MEESISRCNAPALTGLVKEKLTEALPVVYDSTKEGVKNPFFNPVGEVIVDNIH